MDTDDRRYDAITEKIIGCAFKVGSKLGSGFLEKCYWNTMGFELEQCGLRVRRGVALKVWYEGIIVGEYVADLIVEGAIIVELKACDALHPAHVAQCINYLAATKLPLCLLINFGKRVEVKRVAGPALKSSSSVPIGAIGG